MDNTMFQTQRKMALVAGLSLIAMAILAGFAYGYGFESIYVANDRTATLMNLNNSKSLLRWVIFSFVIILILDVVVAWALYIFFKQVNESLSLLSGWLRLVYSAFLGIALINLLFVLQLLNNEPHNQVFVMNSLRIFLDSWSLGLIVFGCHLFLLGYLIFKSDFIPKVFSILTLLASICYLFSSLANLLLTNYEQYKATVDLVLSLPMALGELGLAIWLIFKGGKNFKAIGK